MSFDFLRNCNPQWSRAEACTRERTKACKTCGERKPTGEFYDKVSAKGTIGLHSSCKGCMKVRVQISRRGA